jgi:hypothetical protein
LIGILVKLELYSNLNFEILIILARDPHPIKIRSPNYNWFTNPNRNQVLLSKNPNPIKKKKVQLGMEIPIKLCFLIPIKLGLEMLHALQSVYF